MEHIVFREYVKLCFAISDHIVHAHHGFVARFEGIDHECGTRVESICLERSFFVFIWRNECNALADTVKPIRYLVVHFQFAGAV